MLPFSLKLYSPLSCSVDYAEDVSSPLSCSYSQGHGGPFESSADDNVEADQRRAVDADILVLLYDTPVGEALHKLSTRNILSAPVLDISGDIGYKGFISVHDIILDLTSRNSAEKALLLHQLGEASSKSASAATSPDTFTKMSEWPLLPISEVMSTPVWQDGHMLWRADDPHFERLSVLTLCQDYFFHGNPDGPVCHRVAVLRRGDSLGGRVLTCAGVISMSDVVRLVLREGLGPRSAALEETSDAAAESAALSETVTLEELGIATKRVFCVNAAEPALHAFEKMTRLGLSAVAVVDDRRNVVGNLSESDIRGVLPNRYAALTRPLDEYLALVRASSFPVVRYGGVEGGGERRTSTRENKRPPRPLFCHRSSSFSDAVRLLTDGRLHHVFVAEDCGGEPSVADAAMAERASGKLAADDLVGVLTLTDVLRRVCFGDLE